MERISSMTANQARLEPGAVKRGWQQWVPYAAIAWSILFGILGFYWVISGRGIPFNFAEPPNSLGPLLARFNTLGQWTMITLTGFPAAMIGFVMLKGKETKYMRFWLVFLGAVIAAALLLFMISLEMLVAFGYIPYMVSGLITGKEISHAFLRSLFRWEVLLQLWCMAGGLLWVMNTVFYSRNSSEMCVHCGRHHEGENWTSAKQAANWGRKAVIASLITPVFYAVTRYAWALGVPLGMTTEFLRQGQERGMWTSGVFLATFGLVGGLLTLGLTQRWGEVFPKWMPGLGGRRVPVSLAVVPALIISVLLIVGGIGLWANLPGMAANLAATGIGGMRLVWQLFCQIGATLLFPFWGASLAAAMTAYVFRRRGRCEVCGRAS